MSNQGKPVYINNVPLDEKSGCVFFIERVMVFVFIGLFGVGFLGVIGYGLGVVIVEYMSIADEFAVLVIYGSAVVGVLVGLLSAFVAAGNVSRYRSPK